MADFFNVEDVANKVFYGFKLNHATGKLTVDKIDDSETVVRLPDEHLLRADDYKHWVWTRSTLVFSWNESDPTRLLVEVV